MFPRYRKIRNNTEYVKSHLTDIIKENISNVARFNELEKYYYNENPINNRRVSDGKPNNKIAHAFPRYISNMAAGYFMGKGVNATSDNDQYLSDLQAVLNEEYQRDINMELSKEMSIKGIAFELLFVNEIGKLKTVQLNTQEVIPIFSENVDEYLECAIRLYSKRSATSGNIIQYADLYTNKEVITYANANDKAVRIASRLHNLSDVPIVIYANNKELKGDFEDVVTLVDAYDKAQSDTANDSEYFADAYLVLIGAGDGLIGDIDDADDADGDADQQIKKRMATLRRERIMHLDEKGQAEWLTKNVNDNVTENYKNRLYSDIFFLSQVPALSDEHFSQNLSGVAIKYKLIGLEELAVVKENKYKAAIRKKYKIVTTYINGSSNKQYDVGELKFVFERNIIENQVETIDMVAKLEGIVSKETQLSRLPFVDDTTAEYQRIINDRKMYDGLGMVDDAAWR